MAANTDDRTRRVFEPDPRRGEVTLGPGVLPVICTACRERGMHVNLRCNPRASPVRIWCPQKGCDVRIEPGSAAYTALAMTALKGKLKLC